MVFRCWPCRLGFGTQVDEGNGSLSCVFSQAWSLVYQLLGGGWGERLKLPSQRTFRTFRGTGGREWQPTSVS